MKGSEQGEVFSINTSPGGVPKLPVPEALISQFGIFGDSQKNRKYHGGPERAVCLYSLERIEALQREGHPISAGTTGENLTLSGLDWTLILPGVVLEVGEAVIEVSRFTTPCKTIRYSFAGMNFMRISHILHPGWSRVYARVLREGVVRTGDSVFRITAPVLNRKS